MDKVENKTEFRKNFELGITGISRLKLRDLGYIVSRNLFLLTNGVIFSVVAMLFVFGDHRAAIFLGIISAFNVLAGLFQDINAWLALEKLQLLTAPRVLRLNAKGEEVAVLTEEIAKGDRLKLKIGDQVPSDSLLISAHSFEINEGLITGESDSLPRLVGEHLLAGSVVTSGWGIVEAEGVFQESRIARMTEGIKKYSVNLSPIQRSINKLVKYTGYLLLLVITFIVARGYFVHASNILIVNNIGAISSVLVPAGLVFAATLLFAYGAAHLFQRQVLLQEVNATEKLGHIKNLCMDKTGTLTENFLTVEAMHVPVGLTEAVAKEVVAAYLQGTSDSSQTMAAVKKYMPDAKYVGEIIEARAFSSWRRYGAVRARNNNEEKNIFVGSPDVFLSHMANENEKKWIQDISSAPVKEGKRVLCVMRSSDKKTLPDNLSEVMFSVVAIFVFHNNLREGIQDTIDFFQNRGVRIRIISGDNPETVRAVATAAGVNGADKIVTGQEIERWSEEEFGEKAKGFTIFARIVPEQKEKIIEALKKDGFTAMVGDGANDALAIKKADLGIAMFDGAPATRQLAAVVLMNNSFMALPGGVQLADSVIRNLEIFSGSFINISLAGFFFFAFVSAFGFAFPLTPLNMALINYVSIGMAGMLITYWVIISSDNAQSVSAQPFFKNILPFAAVSAIVQALGLASVFFLNVMQGGNLDSNIPVLLAFIIFGFVFLAVSPRAFGFSLITSQKQQLGMLAIVELLILLAVLKLSLLATFFNIADTQWSFKGIGEMFFIVALFSLLQITIARWFARYLLT